MHSSSQMINTIVTTGVIYKTIHIVTKVKKITESEDMNMKATGIVRRIDDLGRVVIPKEIRRTLRIREGDPLEIFVDRAGEVILKKYSPINELGQFSEEYAEALFDTLHVPVLICDRDEVISLAGLSKKDYVDRRISQELEETIEDRSPVVHLEEASIELVQGVEERVASYCFSPIIAGGDPIGVVAIFSLDDPFDESVKVVAEAAANFLGKQME